MIVTSAKKVKHHISERVVSILATIDGVEYYVPMNTGNMHYEAIQEWVSAGNTIEEAE
tara:strand:+ start:1064 stop:1237 length:174 start_codon:yes stop_codon:yes gene_type:complete